MKPVRIAEDIVPIATFKARAATWLKRAADTGQPVVITQNGKPAGVLLSPSEYDRISEQQRFVESVARGLADSDAGRVMSTAQARQKLAAARKARARAAKKK
jgi:prevent-host-death family protein